MSVRLPPTVNQIRPVQSILDEIPPEAETMEMPPEELELLAEQTMSGDAGRDAAFMHAVRKWHEAEHAGDVMGASFWRRRARGIRRGARKVRRGARRAARTVRRVRRYDPTVRARQLAARRLARTRAARFARRRAAAAKRFAARRARAAAAFAARQLRAVQRKLFNTFFGKLTRRRARYLSAQRRSSLQPTRAESAEARKWARSYIRSKGGILGRMVVAVSAGPMGAEPTTSAALTAIATPVLIRLMNRLLGQANKEGAPANPKIPPPEKLIPQLLFGPGDYGEPEPWGTDFSPPEQNPFGPPRGHDPYGQQEPSVDPFAASPGAPAADYDPYAVSPQPPGEPFDFSW